MCRRDSLLATFVVWISLVLSGSAFAVEPEVCITEEDPDMCQCSTDNWDGCQQVPFSGLLDPNDPLEVREATDLNAEWNAAEERYVVTLDVRDLSNGAVLQLLDNGGEWESLQEFDAYMEKLLGIDIPGPEVGMDSYELPPMRVVQKGIVVRFNQNTGKFIEPNSGDLISSIYLNADNEFRIGGEFIWALDGEVDPHCPGRDNTAAANNGVRQPTDTAINDFKAFQCSSATRFLEPIGERCVPFFFGSTSCSEVLMPNRKAITSIEALPREFSLPQFTCQYTDWNWWEEPVCIPIQGDFVVVKRTLEIESADIDNTYFMGSSLTAELEDTPPLEEAPFVESLDGKDSWGPRGVCAEGVSVRNTSESVTETRDGEYTWGHPACTFQ